MVLHVKALRKTMRLAATTLATIVISTTSAEAETAIATATAIVTVTAMVATATAAATTRVTTVMKSNQRFLQMTF